MFRLLFVALLIFGAENLSAAIYKYKDSSGKWVFSDKKPSSKIESESVKYKSAKKKVDRPKMFTGQEQGYNTLVVNNPLHAPIELEIESTLFGSPRHKQVIPALTSVVLHKSSGKIPEYRYRWVLGDPNKTTDSYRYLVPVVSGQKYRITQSFNGRFSHSQPPSIYAVDIAMQVGTYIGAARGGTVIWVKDDYHMGGRDQFFLDKANLVMVLHEDGTYAVYAHILQGTALVKVGDKVKEGDKLARSGSSGYSTGPHLHFVIRRNDDFKTRSVPFVFADGKGGTFTPRRGMKVPGGKVN
ncbi:peptidoglycan DD-metalloendopeptidase family protein [Maricurvus nonylphenolicus]|uniref:M23 family metallopeptidase n=1 Tax=Maricurvus nonylphenolicus TaxID=1008307 RepID=UPI0036F2A05B